MIEPRFTLLMKTNKTEEVEKLTKKSCIMVDRNLYSIIMVIFMTSYLAYSYSANLTKEERDEIDLRTKKSRKEFSRGFSTGITISVSAAAVYSAYSLFASKAAYALEPIVKSDSPVPDGTPAQEPARSSSASARSTRI